MADLTDSSTNVTTSETPVVFYSKQTMGVPGVAATVAVGATVTGIPGSPAAVHNSGNSNAAVLDFTIPAGSNASAKTTSPFTIPLIGATTTVNVSDASWITIGQMLYFAGASGSGNAGDLQVVGKSGTTLTVKNLSGSGGVSGGGDMFRAVYDPDSDGIVNTSAVALAVDWPNITNKVFASPTAPGLLGTTSGVSTDYVGGDNLCHPSPMPTGTIIDFAGLNPPAGWLPCDGAAVSRTTYSGLYAVLGGAASPWGQGNGSSTFNVPDLRGRVGVGSGTGTYSGATNRVRGATGGEEAHALLVAEEAPHSHTLGNHTHSMQNHTHVGVNHLHYMDHYHNWNVQGSHTHPGVNHLHNMDHAHGIPAGQFNHHHTYVWPANAGNQWGVATAAWGQLTSNTSDVTLPAGSTGTASAAGYPNTGAADRDLTTGAANTPAGNTIYASQTNGAWAYTAAADRDLTTSGPNVNTTAGPSTNSSDPAGLGTPHNTMPPFAVVSKLIRI
jgi:microcystin-dependent protein